MPSKILTGHRLFILFCALVLSACAVEKKSPVIDAVSTPLSDLNLIRIKIPSVLAEAQKDTYKAPLDQSCAALLSDVLELNKVLGPDIDDSASVYNPGFNEPKSAAAGHAAVGSVQDSAEQVVPFRSWIRMFSGADHYSKQYAAAIAAGIARRGFLRGLIEGNNCL